MEPKFIGFVSEIMGVDQTELSLETEYKKYSVWDSIMMMTLIMEIEEEYEVRIPIEKVNTIKTLRDLYELTKG